MTDFEKLSFCSGGNLEGSELLDYMEGDSNIDDLPPAEQSENDEKFSSDEECDQDNVNQDQDDVPTNTPVSAKLSIISSLQNICNDPEVNKEAKFLNNLQNVFEDNAVSLMFKPHLSEVKSAFYEART